MSSLRSSTPVPMSEALATDRLPRSAMEAMASLRATAGLLTVALGLAFSQPAAAHGNPSEASATLSMLPVAISVMAPVAVLSAGAAFVVVAVESTAKGTVWVLQRASDGVKVSVEFAASAVSGVAVSVGTAITVSVIGTGVVLSALGNAIAFIPNEIGASLLHNERVTGTQRVTR
ncbi:hypothetical protein [Roseateles amylovorans]|uniref:Uncharacterized protein n=1 Tax=Roseateles amylovorans TaxID=2978473 RepID=A0ABY6AZE1_9BURK|nr:hypothetical protein [Roseateles amylovorans]UXH78536.1 hypothetical protein N4261_00945 [Roseateles amylovorans]